MYNRCPLKSIYHHRISKFSGRVEGIIRYTYPLIGMGVQPA